MARSLDNLIWIDLEATGLDPETRVILEIACLVTDKDLNELGDGIDKRRAAQAAGGDVADDRNRDGVPPSKLIGPRHAVPPAFPTLWTGSVERQLEFEGGE